MPVKVRAWFVASARRCFAFLQYCGSLLSKEKGALVVSDVMLDQAAREDVLRRARFYAPWLQGDLTFATNLSLVQVFSMRTILFRGDSSPLASALRRVRSHAFDIDPAANPSEGWEWCRVASVGTTKPPRELALRRFTAYIEQVQRENLPKCYVFGTGPSLASALDRDWSDGYRIVCNTIVRDKELWSHLRPHFFVAADAIYHFGFTGFAQQFRNDLRARLAETDTYFLYPEAFHAIVACEFSDFADRLVPVPQGRHQQIHKSLSKTFELPDLGNVLNLVLLPLACTLSRRIGLWGFDGRAPDDKLFWANSSRHSYPELMSDLREAHPAFFQHYVPAEMPKKYVSMFHGDQLDRCLADAEADGWSFVMMHRSWTPTLQKRFSG